MQPCWALQVAGCLSSSPDGSQVLVGSADGSITLLPADLTFKGADSVPVTLHDMWTGAPLWHQNMLAHHQQQERVACSPALACQTENTLQALQMPTEVATQAL